MNRTLRRYDFHSFLFVIMAALCASNAHAVVVYDNFGSGAGFDASAGQGIGSPSDAEYGLLFAPSASGYVSQLTVAASNYSGAGEITFTLYANNLGVPGTALETFNLSGLPAFNTSFPAQTMTASGTTYVDASQSYWLVGSQPNHLDTVIWNSSTVAQNTQVVFRDSTFTSWVPMSHEYQWALRVETGEVPIPGAIVLFCSGLIGLIRLARRNTMAWRF
jgi:hypothetical protein